MLEVVLQHQTQRRRDAESFAFARILVFHASAAASHVDSCMHVRLVPSKVGEGPPGCWAPHPGQTCLQCLIWAWKAQLSWGSNLSPTNHTNCLFPIMQLCHTSVHTSFLTIFAGGFGAFSYKAEGLRSKRVASITYRNDKQQLEPAWRSDKPTEYHNMEI